MCDACGKSRMQRIIDGWSNLVVRDPLIEEMARQRARLCAVCSKNKFNICILCGCPLPAKTRSPEEKCDNGIW